MLGLCQYSVASDVNWDSFGKLKQRRKKENFLYRFSMGRKVLHAFNLSASLCLFHSGQVECQYFFICWKVGLEITLCDYISSGSCKLEFSSIVSFGKTETNVTLAVPVYSHSPFPKSRCKSFQPLGKLQLPFIDFRKTNLFYEILYFEASAMKGLYRLLNPVVIPTFGLRVGVEI